MGRTLKRGLEDELTPRARPTPDLATQRARRPAALTDDVLAFINRAVADVRAAQAAAAG